MGASNFDLIVYGKKSMEEAYKEAYEEALYMDGHEPYNGTISTTNGVRPSPISSTPVREDQIDYNAVSARLDHLNKWETCEAFPIKEVTPARHDYLGVVDVEARMPSALFERSADAGEKHAEAQRVFLREVRKTLKAGGSIPFVRDYLGRASNALTTDGLDLSALEVDRVAVTPEQEVQRTSTRATAGKVETRYFILRENQREMPRWELGYSSQAEARARLPKSLKDPSRITSESYEVISMSRRASGEGLVAHEVSLAGRGKTVPVRLRGALSVLVEKAKVTGRTGWCFYGWAAS